jgi:hypothetical protein
MEAVVLNGNLLYLTSEFIVIIFAEKYGLANVLMNLRVPSGGLLE